MRSWHSSRYDRFIADIEREMRPPLSTATRAWAAFDVRLSRLKKHRRLALAREEREANPRFCAKCGGGLHFRKTYERGLCLECGGEMTVSP